MLNESEQEIAEVYPNHRKLTRRREGVTQSVFKDLYKEIIG